MGEGLIDGRKCLSYLTVEHKGPTDRKYWPVAGGRIFGCDSCQHACPHNCDVPLGEAELVGELNTLASAELSEMLDWTEDQWLSACRDTAGQRSGPERLVSNAIIAAGNSGDASLAPALQRLKGRCPQWVELADWAVERLAWSDQV